MFGAWRSLVCVYGWGGLWDSQRAMWGVGGQEEEGRRGQITGTLRASSGQPQRQLPLLPLPTISKSSFNFTRGALFAPFTENLEPQLFNGSRVQQVY